MQKQRCLLHKSGTYSSLMGSSVKELIEPATLTPDTVHFLELDIKGGVSVPTLDRRPQPSLARTYSLFSQFYRAPHPAPLIAIHPRR